MSERLAESDGPSFELFETMPARVYIDRVRAHVAQTGLPETFPGLHPGPIAKDEPFKILSPISVPRDRRSAGDKAPCPMCQTNKFYEGKLVYFFQLRAVAIIGHCCASALTRNAALLEYEQREARERAEEYLLDWLPKVSHIRSRALAMLPAAREAQRVYGRFRKEAGRFHQALRRAIRGGGELTVTEVIGSTGNVGPAGMRTSGSSVQTRDIRFGIMAGEAVVAARCSILSDLEQCIAALDGFVCGSDEDDVINFVVAIVHEEKPAAAGRLKLAIEAMEKIDSELASFRAFFSTANLERISKWGAHSDAPIAISVSLSDFGGSRRKLFDLDGSDGRGFRVIIEPELWSEPSVGAETGRQMAA